MDATSRVRQPLATALQSQTCSSHDAGGGGAKGSDAAKGATALGAGPDGAGSSPKQAKIASQLEQLTRQITKLTRSLQADLRGGGATGAPSGGDCPMHGGAKMRGSAGSPEMVLLRDPKQGGPGTGGGKGDKHAHGDKGGKAGNAGKGGAKNPKQASAKPSKVKGEESHAGLNDRARRVLDSAHAASLKLVSGSRPGDDGGHGNGTAIDVGNVPLGTKQGSREMEQFAEQMRLAGKNGDSNIGYVIYKQRIASARDNWAWRPMEDRGSNTQNHFDHVHVSTDPKR